MTKEEIIAAHRELLELHKTQLAEIRDMRNKEYLIRNTMATNKRHLIKFSTVQVGDKVLAKNVKRTGNWTESIWTDIEGFVSNIKVVIRMDGSVHYFYDVNAIKKDGKMSLRLIDTYHSKGMEEERVELIKND